MAEGLVDPEDLLCPAIAPRTFRPINVLEPMRPLSATADATTSHSPASLTPAELHDPLARHCSYHYFGAGLTWPPPANVVLIMDHPANHADYPRPNPHALFGDGMIRDLTPAALREALEHLPKNPPGSPDPAP